MIQGFQISVRRLSLQLKTFHPGQPSCQRLRLDMMVLLPRHRKLPITKCQDDFGWGLFKA